MTDRREAYNALMKFYPLTLDDLPDEIWRPIKRYEDFYHVSNYGRVKSFKRKTPRILNPAIVSGYLKVELQIDSKPKQIYIHRLVAEAFIPNPLNKPCVNHINGIKTDNRVENLEWCTYAENNRHAVEAGLHPQGEKTYNAKFTNAQIVYIRDNPDGLNTCEIANKFSVAEPVISAIQLGKKYKSAGGNIRDKFGIPEAIRAEIRRLYKPFDKNFGGRALARRFGLGEATIYKIVRRLIDMSAEFPF